MFIGFKQEYITSAIDQGSVRDWFVMKKVSKSLVRSNDFAKQVGFGTSKLSQICMACYLLIEKIVLERKILKQKSKINEKSF